jgi:hypothetical protein
MNTDFFNELVSRFDNQFEVDKTEYHEGKDTGNIVIDSKTTVDDVHTQFDNVFKLVERKFDEEVSAGKNHYFIVERFDKILIVIKEEHTSLPYRTHKFMKEYDLNESQENKVFTIAGVLEDNREVLSEYSNDDLVLFCVCLVALDAELVSESFEEFNLLNHSITRGKFEKLYKLYKNV